MRLYLSSYGIGNSSRDLQAMAPEGSVVGVICNACDSIDTEARAERTDREFQSLRALGFKPVEIDLRTFFDKKFIERDLAGIELIWVRGGNVFNLRRAMKQSGFDNVIISALRSDRVAYGGFSAGACVLAPSLHGIELCDPVDDIPAGYHAATVWEGLNIIRYAIAPHYKSDHPESAMIDDVVDYFIANDLPYRTLHDGEVIVADDRIEP